MTSYTVTISGDDDPQTTTTVRLSANAGRVVLTDLHLSNPTGLTGGQLPSIDFDLLMRAVTLAPIQRPARAAARQVIEATPAPGPARSATPAPAVKTSPRSKATRPTKTATPTKATAPGKATATTKAAHTGTSEPRATTSARKAAAKSPAAAPSSATEPGSRTYKRMPDEFEALLRQTSSPSVLAEALGEPVQRVRNWIKTVNNRRTT